MKVKTLVKFRDLKEENDRKPGDTFIVSQDRFEEINSTKYGVLVEEIEEVEEEQGEQEQIEYEDEEVVETDITELNVADLKEIAKERNIEGYSNMKKDELIESLRGGLDVTRY